MKKRSIAILLGALITAETFAGCGSASTGETSASTTNSGATNTYIEAEQYVDGVSGMADSSPSANAEGAADAEAAAVAEAAPAENYNTARGEAEEAVADSYYETEKGMVPEYNTETYKEIKENNFTSVAENPLSTFSADVDTASYANMRRMIREGYTAESIPSGAIRTEELINYFDYEYRGPKKGEPFGVNAVIGECPWNEDSKLLMMGLQTEEIPSSELPSSNIVFLIDTSGSMYSEDKLPLLQQSFEMLVDEGLDKNDRVSIVTYAGSSEVVLEGVSGNKKDKIIDALYSLEANGSTNGGDGIITAYRIAEEYFIEGGNNRVIIASDGDMNVGITDDEDLRELIEEKRKSGVFLSVLGFGDGNYQDDNMETLADAGNGNYSYIDCLDEAKKVLIDELSATILTVAKDVKFQIEFNPAVVSEYRLIGYENRVLNTQDFEDDTKDAGEIGAGHSVTVMYELTLCDEDNSDDAELRYQESKLTDRALLSAEWLTLSIRYKKPGEEESQLLEYPIGTDCYDRSPSEDFYFAAAVAEFGMFLNDSDYLCDGGLEHTLDNLEDMRLSDDYREEFYELVETVYERENDPYYYDPYEDFYW